MNHRWEDNKCIRCGVKRKRHNEKILMAVCNHPPWEAYRHEVYWIFTFDGLKWSAKRPDCKKIKTTTMKISDLKKQKVENLLNSIENNAFGISDYSTNLNLAPGTKLDYHKNEYPLNFIKQWADETLKKIEEIRGILSLKDEGLALPQEERELDNQILEQEISRAKQSIADLEKQLKKVRLNRIPFFGDVVRAKCGAVARYINFGKCLYVSSMCNELCVDYVDMEADWKNDNLHLPDDKEMERFRSMTQEELEDYYPIQKR